MKLSKKTKAEIALESVKGFLRVHFDSFNKYENEELSMDFYRTVKAIKEKNSKIVFETYYMPKAIAATLREDNYLATEQQLKSRATAMMLNDLAQGVLTDFYKFK